MAVLDHLIGKTALLAPTGGGNGRRAGEPWSLALQGGGSFGAFTWGVLDRLLETRRIGFDTISGSSAGAINAAVMASGIAKGGPDAAREALERFWRRASGAAPSAKLHRALAASSQMLSPYQFNPFDLNPLRMLLQSEIDFDRIRTAPPFGLIIGATRVKDGTLRLFREREICSDMLLASACLPHLAQSVVIDGEDFWDGGYAANPPLIPLIEASRTPNTLVVQIVPTQSGDHLRSVTDITRRLENLTFNASLQRDLEALATMKAMAREGGPAMAQHRIAASTVEVVAAEDFVPGLAQADPLDLDWGFIAGLRDAGRRAVDGWASARRVTEPVAV